MVTRPSVTTLAATVWRTVEGKLLLRILDQIQTVNPIAKAAWTHRYSITLREALGTGNSRTKTDMNAREEAYSFVKQMQATP